MRPCWLSVRMTMLANQPSTPPTTSQMIKFMVLGPLN
jgi:hypothetical protein